MEAIRHGTAPPIIKRQASRGTIPVATEEMLEILVLLTADPDTTCSDTARATLASWPEEKIAQALAEPETSPEMLAYFGARGELSELLLNVIATHPHADDSALAPLAARLSLAHLERICGDPAHLAHLPNFTARACERKDLPAELRRRLEGVRAERAKEEAELAAALAREEEHEAQAPEDQKRERISLTQKVARMSVSERMQLALKGSRDERMILIRDPSKVVYRAVLQSPKLSDSEVEGFASMKNIADEALRLLGTQRQFLKNYGVVRNLVNNPRTPLDVGLTLMNRLTDQDIKYLTKNRNVSETLRNLAVKMHKQRTSTRSSGSGH